MNNKKVYILIGVALTLVEQVSATLKVCPEKVLKKLDKRPKSKISKGSPLYGKGINCSTVRRSTAKQRHKFQFIDPGNTVKLYVRLDCWHCLENEANKTNLKRILWYFVPRKIGENPFRRLRKEKSGSFLGLLNIGSEVTNNHDYCLDEDRNLIIMNFSPKLSAGIYYCSDESISPDIKYIWYHVDSLIVPQAFENLVKKEIYIGRLSKYTAVDKVYVNKLKVDKAIDEVIDNLNLTIPDYLTAAQINAFYLKSNSSDYFDNDEKWTQFKPDCGSDLMRYRYYKCRLEMPRAAVTNLLSETNTDLEPMKLLITAHYNELLRMKNMSESAMKVYFYADDMVPPQRRGTLLMNCYSTILMQYDFLFRDFKPMKGILKAKKVCPGLNPSEALALFHEAEDMGDIKEKMMGEDLDMPMKISIVNVERTRVTFACGGESNTLRRLYCLESDRKVQGPSKVPLTFKCL